MYSAYACKSDQSWITRWLVSGKKMSFWWSWAGKSSIDFRFLSGRANKTCPLLWPTTLSICIYFLSNWKWHVNVLSVRGSVTLIIRCSSSNTAWSSHVEQGLVNHRILFFKGSKDLSSLWIKQQVRMDRCGATEVQDHEQNLLSPPRNISTWTCLPSTSVKPSERIFSPTIYIDTNLLPIRDDSYDTSGLD